MGIESLALDAEGEYRAVAEALGGINVVISPTSKTVINLFDVEIEHVKDEITGKERPVLNVENKVEDVTQAILTMARGSTKSKDVNELTKQIIAETVADEYVRCGITSDPNSLYKPTSNMLRGNLYKEKKLMPTIGSWYKTLERKAKENDEIAFNRTIMKKVRKEK